MNKKHWNTIQLDGNLRNTQVIEWIYDSYNLVAAGLTKKEKSELMEIALKELNFGRKYNRYKI